MGTEDKEDKGFAERWSKRKVAARESEADAVPLPEEEISPAVQETDEELLSEEDFDDVDFDALDKSSDYTRFIKANVPAAIQKKALRKLWGSDPVFEVLDGMNDYDEDFTGNGLAGKVLKTAYKVGRGFLNDEDEPDKTVDEVVKTAAPEEEGTEPETEPKEETEQS